jgi:3-oxoacyl-ACP reductase-like protein
MSGGFDSMKNNGKHSKKPAPTVAKATPVALVKPASAAPAAPKAPAQDKSYIEEYTLESQELAELRFVNEHIGKLRADLVHAETQGKELLQRLGMKYLENGSYQGVAPLDLTTGKGTRVRVK